MRLVGIDYLSIDPADAADLPAHRALLAAGVLVVEGLDLRDADAGEWSLLCLPRPEQQRGQLMLKRLTCTALMQPGCLALLPLRAWLCPTTMSCR